MLNQHHKAAPVQHLQTLQISICDSKFYSTNAFHVDLNGFLLSLETKQDGQCQVNTQLRWPCFSWTKHMFMKNTFIKFGIACNMKKKSSWMDTRHARILLGNCLPAELMHISKSSSTWIIKANKIYPRSNQLSHFDLANIRSNKCNQQHIPRNTPPTVTSCNTPKHCIRFKRHIN